MTITIRHREVRSLEDDERQQFCCLVAYAPNTGKAIREQLVRAAREADPDVRFLVKPNTVVGALFGGYVDASYYAGSATNVKGELLCVFKSAEAEAAFIARVGE